MIYPNSVSVRECMIYKTKQIFHKKPYHKNTLLNRKDMPMLSPILACSNVPQAIEYYTQKLGFQLAWQMPPNEQGVTDFACVQLGDAEILLGVTEGFVKPEDMGKRGIGVQIYINLPDSFDIDTIYANAKTNGATITREIETREWGERAFNVSDADGYTLMIAQQVKKA